MKPGTLLIDSSTIDVESARKAHALAAERGCLVEPVVPRRVVAGDPEDLAVSRVDGEGAPGVEPILIETGVEVCGQWDEGVFEAGKRIPASLADDAVPQAERTWPSKRINWGSSYVPPF